MDWEAGQKTGFFIDQRENRRLLKEYARNARVLNLFDYTGGFSVYAAAGGCQSVDTVDSSQVATELAEKNMKLNRLALEKIQPGGFIFTFSCSQVVSKENFRKTVFTASANTGRKVRVLHQLSQPADHPVNI